MALTTWTPFLRPRLPSSEGGPNSVNCLPTSMVKMSKHSLLCRGGKPLTECCGSLWEVHVLFRVPTLLARTHPQPHPLLLRTAAHIWVDNVDRADDSQGFWDSWAREQTERLKLPGYPLATLLQGALSEARQVEQVDSKGEEQSSGNSQKSKSRLQPSGSKNAGAKKRKLDDAWVSRNIVQCNCSVCSCLGHFYNLL